MKKSALLVRVIPAVLLALALPLSAAQDTVKTAKKQPSVKAQAKTPAKAAPQETAGPSEVSAPADTGARAKPVENTPAQVAPQPQAQQPASLENPPAAPVEAIAEPAPQLSTALPQPADSLNSVEKMRQEASRLSAEAKALRDMADTLQRASDEAEERADEADDKAEDLEDQLDEVDVQKVAQQVKVEIERIKRLIQADVERIKRLHGARTTDDSLYTLQADSLDSILAHLSADTSLNRNKQKQLIEDIRINSDALMVKSREMASKARELEESAEKREELAEDLTGKADELAEEQNPLPLSKRFPWHFGFQLRLTDVGPFNDRRIDPLLLHGFHVSYSITPNFEAGLQDVTVYSQETIYGTRWAITAAPSVRLSFFPAKRLQLGAAAGVSMQARAGCLRPVKIGAAPFIALSNEVWVRNHFSISPLIRINYAAYGPYYTVALSQHSGALPQGAVWLDFGIGYNFSF